MKLYINIETRNQGATKNSNEKCYLNIDNISDLKEAVINHFISRFTWAEMISFNVVARLDGACNSIDSFFYKKQPCKVVARKERYEFTKGVGKLVWSENAVVYA